MFSEDRVSSIFGNMESLFQFQSSFLQDLETCINWAEPHKSCIGDCFVKNVSNCFNLY